MKKVINDTNKEMKHYLGLLNEMHGENLRGIREGSIIVNRKIDNITEILDKHTKILDSHTEMIGVLMEDTSVIKSDLKRKVDYDDFLSLVKRVQKIEAKI
ncbi:MAG: hypothetical protein UR90_C0003G0005 [Parcubacteria group bacterium GW2011_GWC1_35_8]|uniref:Uncharacterized protein n=2 Tax=Candidatus Nomuraibacteriota TaxID=1752729 RepID=A0A1F6YU85_9BACT|nr:MAG: hypothetical protein UR90_C0003G0005 [Parcubacteria group bacterium GW2011_GWC1_35_8]KKP88925.1 MAG: hypothetical protein UR91_C0010G0004 [Candidatus Nomurabacteria bacterium GW2011_GWC2_35_8]OGJ05830.1 MAG: hypothetical protein A2238_02005 [Candidatus Nomurabacteria bacterium RIFOXYA2_FULL_35_9]OGJ09936.1 MAG: hypothetical protein A2456_01590 [Candidatus Nomurabacteria bacterium RIFOXYC2_FULL_36_19]OGJ15182.1 MAG: hypothetical protein A2554_03110 [Candidatus Nomurabacteria bacterium RI